jgi:predicted Zn finger-like uncharacterized protein
MTPATCPNCRTEVRVDLARVPAGRVARVACPTCSTAFTVGGAAAPAGAPAGASAAAPGPAPSVAAAVGRDEAWLRKEMEALRAEIEKDVIENVLGRVLSAVGRPIAHVDGEDDEGRPALVCEGDPATANAMASVLGELGFSAQPCPDLTSTWRALDQDQRFVVVSDTVGGDPEAASKILERLSRLPGAKRRRLFVAYVSADVKTADGGLAFVLGANMTICRADLARFKEHVRRGVTERDKLYKPFLFAMEAASETGGA